jgi:alkaline phosphatase D
VITKDVDTNGSGPKSKSSKKPRKKAGAQGKQPEELDVVVTIEEEEKPPQPWRSLIWGLPSPTSGFWTMVTFAINLALVSMSYDYIYRAPTFYAAEDLAFSRVGYVSPNSAKVFIREPHVSKMPIFLSYRHADTPLGVESGYKRPDTAWKSAGSIASLSNDTDYTTTLEITSLKPDTRYEYSFSNNQTGSFITAPERGKMSRRNGGKFTFVHSSCIKARFPYSLFEHPLAIPGYRHLARWIPELKAHFMIFLGDFIYIDVPQRLGKDVATYRREYRQMYASPDWPAVSKELPWLHVLDDHEIQNDWQGNSTGLYQAAVEPWEHYHVAANPPRTSKGDTYFSFTQGPASFFLLDTRGYRVNGTNPDANDASKSMLGARQLRDLLTFLRTPAPPGVRWKIVISSIPFTKNWRFGSEDTWGGFLAERQLILEAMWDVSRESQGVGVIVLSGDRHEFAATKFPPPKGSRWDDVRGGDGSVYEFSCSPLSMFYLPYRTYEQRDEEDVMIK